MISKSPISAEKVYNEVLSKEISSSAAIEILISLLEGSNNNKIRMKSLEVLGKICHKTKRAFKILENILVSDENPSIRAKAASIIINKYINEGFTSLEWIIQYDNSKLVLKTLIKLFKKIKNHKIESLDTQLKARLISIYGIAPHEAEFLLDLELEVDFFNMNYLKMYSTSSESSVISGNYMMCAIKNGHIKALNLSNWGLNKLPQSIGALSKLQYLILRHNKIETLPDSIGLLRRLKLCDLSGCNIISLPDSISKLNKLKKLSINQNYNLNNIPYPIILIARKYVSRKYIWEGVIPSEAFVLALLEILSGSKLEQISLDNLIISKNKASNYKINKSGHIIGIYIFNSQFSNLTILPSHICFLEHLIELELPNNDIKIIPNSIGKLINLQRLNLRNNMIENVPESLETLKNLNCLKLSGNRIKKIPPWIKKKLDKFENTEDLNGFKRYFFGIPISEIIRKYH
ncbi:MAG: hypothetical protein EU532_07000 [Promethearchaeota archaeon]|nr:MAG: hypothetical protein EU532_07000 [Candidatus Lokiarchaeota archaeon]